MDPWKIAFAVVVTIGAIILAFAVSPLWAIMLLVWAIFWTLIGRDN